MCRSLEFLNSLDGIQMALAMSRLPWLIASMHHVSWDLQRPAFSSDDLFMFAMQPDLPFL